MNRRIDQFSKRQGGEATLSKPAAVALPLRTNFQWTFGGNVVNVLCQWGLFTLLVKVESPATVGKFVLGLAIAAPIMAASMLQLRAVQVTDARGEFSFRHYFGTRIVLTVVAVAVIVGIAWWGSYDVETSCVIGLIGLAKGIDAVSEILRGLFQRYERMNLSGLSLMIRGPAALVLFGGLIWLTGNLPVAVGGLVIAYLAVLALYDLPQGARLLGKISVDPSSRLSIAPSFTPGVLVSLCWKALPLGAVMFLGSLQNNVSRYVLQADHGDAPLGYFGAIAYPMAVGALLVSALGQAASPRLASTYITDITQYRRLIGKLLLFSAGLGVLLTAGVIVLGRSVLTILYSADYAHYETEFIYLAVAAALTLMTACAGCALTAARVFRLQLLLALFSCSTAIGAALWLIPTYGIRGAAMTAVATAVVMFLSNVSLLGWLIAKRRRQCVGAGLPSTEATPPG